MKIISFASSKGGAGKSTSCATLACYFADAKSQRVRIIDADRNASLRGWAERFPRPNIDLIWTEPESFTDALSDALGMDDADYLFLDVPGAAKEVLGEAIGASDLVVIPAQLSAFDLEEAAKIVKKVKSTNLAHKRSARFQSVADIRYKILFTMVDHLGSNFERFLQDDVKNKSIPVFSSVLMRRIQYKEMFATPDAPHQHPKPTPEITALAQEIEAIFAEPQAERAAS